MNIGVPGEVVSNETRVALVPDAARELQEAGHTVIVSSGLGRGAGWYDSAYRDAGCTVVDDREAVFEQANVVFQVRGLANGAESAVDSYRNGQIIIGLLDPYAIDPKIEEMLEERELTAFALELIPRISRAQRMDALSSMASIGGYKAAVMAADTLPKMFPMQMTAAGTVQPAEVFVVGAGVAGLQAIATAGRLGASVKAYDIRPEVKEEVESLGAEFVELDLETDDAADEEGHAREQDEDFYQKQREMMRRVVAESDVVITTAAIPGKPSPELVTTSMIEEMEPGSVIIDLAAAGGGNCEPTSSDEEVMVGDVRVFGPTNLPGRVPRHASELYSNNVVNFFQYIYDDDEGTIAIDPTDEIVDATMLANAGTVRSPHVDGDEPEEEND